MANKHQDRNHPVRNQGSSRGRNDNDRGSNR